MPADNMNNGVDFVLIDEKDALAFLSSLFGNVVGEEVVPTAFVDAIKGTNKSIDETFKELEEKFHVQNKRRHTEPFDTDDNGAALAYHGLKIVHINDPHVRNAGMTVCYREPKGFTGKHPSTFEVATAIVHPKDTFNKKEGTAVAMKNFLDGKTVLLPTIPGASVTQSILGYFEALFY